MCFFLDDENLLWHLIGSISLFVWFSGGGGICFKNKPFWNIPPIDGRRGLELEPGAISSGAHTCISTKNNNFIQTSLFTFKLFLWVDCNVLGIPSINFSNQRSKLKLTRVHRHFRSSSFGNACTFFRFSKLGQLRFWKTTINLSTVLGIPSSYFSNQRLKLKLTIGTMNSSLGIACTFFRFSKLGQLRLWKKTIILSTVLGIPSINFSNQRSKLKLTRVLRHFRSSSFGNACTFFRFSKLGQLRFWKKTINLSTVLGIPSSYFSNRRLKLKLTIGTMNSSFGNACSFFRFCKLRQLRFWKKQLIYPPF